MKINVKRVLVEKDGVTAAFMTDGDKKVPYTFRCVFVDALLKTADGDIAPDVKSKNWKLMNRIQKNEEVTLTVDEAAYLKKILHEQKYNLLVWGQVEDLFENPNVDDVDEISPDDGGKKKKR